MATAPGSDDIQIRVSLRTEQAKKETKELDDAFKAVGSKMGGYLLGGAATAFAAIYGQSMMRAGGTLLGGLSQMGRATPLGQAFERYGVSGDIRQNARAQTAEMFGPAGLGAGRDQVMSIYRGFAAIEGRELKGRQAVEKIIDEETLGQAVDEFKRFVMEMGEAIAQMTAALLRFKAAGPEIR